MIEDIRNIQNIQQETNCSTVAHLTLDMNVNTEL